MFGHPVFNEYFVATISTRFRENARETRATVSELVGGGVRLIPTQDLRELVVCCGLGGMTLPLAQLSHPLRIVQGEPRGDSVRWPEEIVG